MKLKVICYQDFDLSTFGVAKNLQEKHNCDLFSIIDITNRPKKFFQEQSFVKYLKKWFYHDHIFPNKKPDLEYLRYIEKNYKIDIWKIAYNDRIFFKYTDFKKFTPDEILSIIEQGCKLFESILDEINPDFVITPVTNSGRMHIFYEMCKAKDIKVLMLVGSRFGTRQIISEEAEILDYHDELSSNNTSRTLKELQNYLKGHDAFKEAAQYSDAFQKSKLQFFKAAINFFLFSKNTNLKTHYTYYGRTKLRLFFNYIGAMLKKNYRLNFMNKNLSRKIDDEPFIFFPMITEPERSLLIASPFHTNQFELIEHIVKSLPIGYKLYVKDHPSMSTRDWRPVSFYKQIMELPNVKLLHPLFPPYDVVKKCSLVITAGGTTGLEAPFYERPSITFVDTIYSKLKAVYLLKNIEDLPNAIRSQINKKIDLDDLNSFVNLIDKNSFEFNRTELDNDILQTFFYHGFLQDAEIKTSIMSEFLQRNQLLFDLLGLEYAKKIKQHQDTKIMTKNHDKS
jgi:hypothetical protein